MPAQRVRLAGGDGLDRLARELRRVSDRDDIEKELRSRLRGVAKPMVDAVRAKVRSISSRGQNARRGRASLRRDIAAATVMQTFTLGDAPGWSVTVDRRQLGEGRSNLAAYLEGEHPFHRWRHPVFGNDHTWVQQSSSPYFYDTLRPMESQVTREGERVVADIAKQIERRIR